MVNKKISNIQRFLSLLFTDRDITGDDNPEMLPMKGHTVLTEWEEKPMPEKRDTTEVRIQPQDI